MEISVMGLRISCTRAQQQRPGGMDLSAAKHRQRSIEVYLEPDDWMNRVQWPDGTKLDTWTALEYRKVLLRIFDWHHKGHFSICHLDDVLKIFQTEPSVAGQRAYKKLLIIHCVDYNTLPFEIVEQIPGLINTVLGVQEAEYTREPTADTDTGSETSLVTKELYGY